MRGLVAAVLVPCAVAGVVRSLPAGPPPPKLVEHTSDAGRYRAAFPHQPRTETTDIGTAAGAVRLVTEKAEAGRDVVFAVTFADYPDVFDGVTAKTLLDGVRDGLRGSDGKVVSDGAVWIGPAGTGLPGRDVRIEAGRNAVRVRAVVAGKRLYQVMVTGPKDHVGGKSADAFLASFEVVP